MHSASPYRASTHSNHLMHMSCNAVAACHSLIHIDLTPLSLKVSLVDALGHSNRFTDVVTGSVANVYRALFQDRCLN